jgi:hypothetical protein
MPKIMTRAFSLLIYEPRPCSDPLWLQTLYAAAATAQPSS